MRARRFLLQTLILTAAGSLLVLGVNYAVDPYGITGAPRLSGFNQHKTDINEYSRLLKRYQPTRGHYDTLLVGNSRVEMGLDPTHTCLSAEGGSTYNLGIPGATLRTQLEYAFDVLYQQPIRRVFLGVDFFDFIRSRPPAGGTPPLLQKHTGELRYLPMGSPNPDYYSAAFRDYYGALFSLDALTSSLRTVVLQDEFSPDRDERGFNPARDYAAVVRIQGPRALFDQKMQELRSRYEVDLTLRDRDGQLVSEFDDLRSFLQVARIRGIEVVLFTSPLHVAYWDLLAGAGQMPLYREWLAEVTQIAADFRGGEFSLWDFSGDTAYIREPIPAPGIGHEALQWFWEPVHFRRELGDLMLDAMLTEHCGVAVQFGRQIL